MKFREPLGRTAHRVLSMDASGAQPTDFVRTGGTTAPWRPASPIA